MSASLPSSLAPAGSPFDLADASTYQRWRAARLACAPRALPPEPVPVENATALCGGERAALRTAIVRSGFAIYRTELRADDPALPRLLAAQLGMQRLDANWLAGEDGISRITVGGGSDGRAASFYTDHAIGWHTDGYYHPQRRRIRGMVLHCVRPAAQGGENRLLDPDLAYIALRDRDPRLVHALMQPGAMTIPARDDAHGVARAAQSGPVFAVEADGTLHMRYTARTRSIAWHDDAATQDAAAALREKTLASSPFVWGVRLQAGMGLVGRNVLHDRSAFADDPGRPRLVLRARFLDAPGGGTVAQWVSIWRAAQLAGVPRAVLQQQVRSGAIEENDGLVSTTSLLALYPELQLEAAGLAERVARIRDEAFGKRVRERLLPTQEVLAQRLFQQTQELADVQRHLQRYHALVVSLREEIRRSNREVGGDDPRLLALERALASGLARVLATEPADPLQVMDDVLKVMSAQVTLRPSGHQFTVEGRDSLLQAGLRAGLNLNYGCGNGTCGMCKVRVTAGEVARCAPSDYPLSEAEKAQGYVLACAHTAASSDVTIETLEAAGPSDIPEQQVAVTVRAVRPLATDTLLLHLQTPRTHRLRFLAGQSAVLALADGDGARARYPIASCPCDDRNLQFLVARDAQDPLATRLFAGAVKPGDSLTLWGPSGRFTLQDAAQPLVFAVCDTAFAPVRSLIEHALSLDAAPSLALFWLATRADGHFLANQCRAWSEAFDPFEYSLFTDADAASGAAQIAGAMQADLFPADCVFYLAGPPAFVATLAAQLAQAGVPAGRIHQQELP